jgi:hypothetical protein
VNGRNAPISSLNSQSSGQNRSRHGSTRPRSEKHGSILTARRLFHASLSTAWALTLCGATLPADSEETSPNRPRPHDQTLLIDEQWRALGDSTDRALAWLAAQQKPDGSFQTDDRAQPAITSLAVLAFLSCGHEPGAGRYGDVLERAVQYVLSCRRPDGLICRLQPEDKLIERGASHTGTYNHAISGLMLAEVYGMAPPAAAGKLRDTIHQAIEVSLALQRMPPKRNTLDRGGWRYLRVWYPNDSDISVTAWHLMFLRSARNAGFTVPADAIDQALGFVERCVQADGRVYYGLIGDSRRTTITTVGAGTLSLSLAGRHDTQSAHRAGEWLLGSRLPHRYGMHRFHYHAFYYTQALHQLGGKYWQQAYPPMLRTLLERQRPEGSWNPDVGEPEWGPCLSTSLAVLTLSVPYHLLPIFQR